MRFLRVITVLSALAAVSACAATEPVAMTASSPAPVAAAPPPAPAPAMVEEVAVPPQPVAVHFNHGKADITGSTMQVLWGLAPALKAAEPSVIRIQGFTDASGKAAYNKILSEKRAQAVADQLRKLGVTARIEVVGQGIVKGGKTGTKDQGARRVEISWDPAVAKTSASAPVPSSTLWAQADTLRTQADAPDPGVNGIAGAVPATSMAETVSYAGFIPVLGSPPVTDWAVSCEATGPPATLS